MSDTTYAIALVQMHMTANAEENLTRAIGKVREAAGKGANVICLPELFRSPYFCQTEDAGLFDLAEPVPGPSTEAFGHLSKELAVSIIVPLFERRTRGVYHNSAAVMNEDGKMASLYRKMHIPDDPSYYEKFYFTPGDRGFTAVETRAARFAVLICWDQWFPEGARLAALQGATTLFYPTAIGWHPKEKAQFGKAQREAWQTVQRGHAVANGLYVGAVNRVGHERLRPDSDGIEFWGSSFIADPQGVVIAEASVDREEILVAEIDLAHLEDVRRNWPFLRDRRIDAYGGLTSRFLDEPST